MYQIVSFGSTVFITLLFFSFPFQLSYLDSGILDKKRYCFIAVVSYLDAWVNEVYLNELHFYSLCLDYAEQSYDLQLPRHLSFVKWHSFITSQHRW